MHGLKFVILRLRVVRGLHASELHVSYDYRQLSLTFNHVYNWLLLPRIAYMRYMYGDKSIQNRCYTHYLQDWLCCICDKRPETNGTSKPLDRWMTCPKGQENICLITRLTAQARKVKTSIILCQFHTISPHISSDSFGIRCHWLPVA